MKEFLKDLGEAILSDPDMFKGQIDSKREEYNELKKIYKKITVILFIICLLIIWFH